MKFKKLNKKKEKIKMREGMMFYNTLTERMDIRFSIENFYGGLHCGECLEVQIDGQWRPTRIEMRWQDDAWYLVGIETDNLQGLKVRI